MWGDVARCRRGRPREGAHLSAHTIARPSQLAPATQVLLRAPRRLRLWRGSPALRSAGARRRAQVRAQLRRRLHHGEVWRDIGRYGQLRRRLHAASPRAALAGVPPEGGGGGGGADEVARRLARLARAEGARAAEHDERVLGPREGDLVRVGVRVR